jgi:hypothetical protein
LEDNAKWEFVYCVVDTVKSSRDSPKTLLTLFFTREKLFPAFLINRCTKGSVRLVFDNLEKRMETYEFNFQSFSSISLIDVWSSVFHSVLPFAFLPITIAAANEGLVKI